MSNIDEIRAKLRSDSSPASSAGWFGLGALVTCAIAFVAVLLVLRIVPLDSSSPVQTSLSPVEPSLSPVQPSESTPSFLRFGEPPAPPARTIVANYEGKSAAEIGKIADQLCFHRAHTRSPHWSKTPRLTNQNLADFRPEHMDHFNELLRCLLGEGTRRYCLASERRMIVAEIATYFRGIAHRNQLAKWYFDENRPRMEAERAFEEVKRELGFGGPDRATQLQRASVNFDPTVVAAIEYRLRDGLLTKANRDEIAAAAPPPVRDRLVRIDPPQSNCPQQPWWAFWR